MFKTIRRWFSRPRNPAGNVYYARLLTPQGVFYKLGYTSKPTLSERMAYGESGDEKLIDQQFFFTFRKDAWDVEQTLLDHFDRHRVFGKYSNDPTMPLAGRGQSELFDYDVLGLDDDLYKLHEEETLMAMRDDSEQDKEGCLMILIGIVLIPFTLGLSAFFILVGGSGVFGRKSLPKSKWRSRPVHPPTIKELVDALK